MTLWLMVALVVGQTEEASSSSSAAVQEELAPFPESPRPVATSLLARGSTDGFWGLADFGFGPMFENGLSLSPFGVVPVSARAGGQLGGVFGYGARVVGVPLVVSAGLNAAMTYNDERRGAAGLAFISMNLSNLELAVALTDVLNDRAVTGLRVTPMLAADVPVNPRGWAGGAPLTQFRLGAQVERRFGNLELAYRVEGKHAVFRRGCPSTLVGDCLGLQLTQSIQGEFWTSPSFSVLASVGFDVRWAHQCLAGITASCQQVPHTRVLVARAQASWRPFRLVVVSLEVLLRNSTFLAERVEMLEFVWRNSIGGALWLTLRSDPVLERNWIER